MPLFAEERSPPSSRAPSPQPTTCASPPPRAPARLLPLQDVIEPVLKPQWWVNCKDMAAASCAAVRDGSLEIIPKASGVTTWAVQHSVTLQPGLIAQRMLTCAAHVSYVTGRLNRRSKDT
jgi:hypothetical protein